MHAWYILQLAEDNGMDFLETSARTAENISEVGQFINHIITHDP